MTPTPTKPRAQLHKLLTILFQQFTPNQTIFLVTISELAGGKWIRRRDVYDSTNLSQHSSNVAEMTGKLRRLKMIEQEKRFNGINEGDWYIQLTKEALDVLEGARKAAIA